MTPPTTRAELVEFIAESGSVLWDDLTEGERDYVRDKAKRILAALDTFATVCPREPTREMIDTAWEETTDVSYDGVRAAIAASPFAPEKTDG